MSTPLPPQFMGRMVPNALSVKDQGVYGTSGGNFEVTDLLNDPRLEGVVRVFGAGFTEKLPSLVCGNVSPLNENIANSLLIRKNRG